MAFNTSIAEPVLEWFVILLGLTYTLRYATFSINYHALRWNPASCVFHILCCLLTLPCARRYVKVIIFHSES